ncbi:MAG: class B sortase [Anaerolineaceae bacterium]|nr:class B sortase [Anaerolineaceae bacterium]
MESKRRLLTILLSIIFVLSTALAVSFGMRYREEVRQPLLEMTLQSEKIATFMADYNLAATTTPSLTPTNLPQPGPQKLLPPTPSLTPTPTPNPHAKELQHALSLVEINFPAWQRLNKDVQAWIHNHAIGVDLPIVDSPDNEYYLTRDIDLSYKAMGSLFFDYRNNTDFSDPNTIIYGHNFDNGLMFSNLVWYKSQQFYKQNPFYYLYTPEQVYRVDIAAGIVVSETDTTYLKVDFQSDMQYRSLIYLINDNSVIETGIDLSPHDQIVTLYTCTNDWQGQRFVLIGKVTRLGPFNDR